MVFIFNFSTKFLLLSVLLRCLSVKSLDDSLNRQGNFLNNDNLYKDDDITQTSPTSTEEPDDDKNSFERESYEENVEENFRLCSLEPYKDRMICRCQEFNTRIKCIIVLNVSEDALVWDKFAEVISINHLHFTSRSFGIPWRLPPNVLKYLPELKTVFIQHSQLSFIGEEAFSHLNQLLILGLDNNHIEELGHKSFSHLPKLNDLTLSENYLTRIPSRTFVDLPKLRVLFLDRNNISSIEDSAFADLNELRELELWSNQLMRVSHGTFYGLKKLHRLDLSINKLTRISRSTFSSMPHLRELYLQNNLIMSIDNLAFNGLPHLQTLRLNDNLLRVLPPTPFAHLPSLLMLDLRKNHLIILQSTVLNTLPNIHNQSAALHLNDNPFECNCSLYWMRQMIDDFPDQSPIPASLKLVTCQDTGIYYNLTSVSWAKNQCEEKRAGPISKNEMTTEEEKNYKIKPTTIMQQQEPQTVHNPLIDVETFHPTPMPEVVQDLISTTVEFSNDFIDKVNHHHQQQTEKHLQMQTVSPETVSHPENSSETRTFNIFVFLVGFFFQFIFIHL